MLRAVRNPPEDPPVSFTLGVARAEHATEVRVARRLVAKVYGERYGVTFTSRKPDPERKLEPWPDHFVLGRVDDEVVVVAGLYTRTTYAERYGGVTRLDVARVAAQAGVSIGDRPFVEYTRLVVKPGWEGQGLGATFLAITHGRGFLAPKGGITPLVLASGKLSVFHSVYARAKITTRTIAPFPSYPSHELYRSANDPMESRLTIPELDLDPITHSLQLPLNLDFAMHGARRVA